MSSCVWGGGVPTRQRLLGLHPRLHRPVPVPASLPGAGLQLSALPALLPDSRTASPSAAGRPGHRHLAGLPPIACRPAHRRAHSSTADFARRPFANAAAGKSPSRPLSRPLSRPCHVPCPIMYQSPLPRSITASRPTRRRSPGTRSRRSPAHPPPIPHSHISGSPAGRASVSSALRRSAAVRMTSHGRPGVSDPAPAPGLGLCRVSWSRGRSVPDMPWAALHSPMKPRIRAAEICKGGLAGRPPA